MRRLRRRDLATTLVSAPPAARQQLFSQIFNPPVNIRVIPGPLVTSPVVYARIRYQVTRQRQWIVAPTLKPPN